MRSLFELRTLVTMGSAALMAALGIVFQQANFFAYLYFRILYFGETLFHEMGHTIFFWLFGTVAIPSIITMIGAGKAGGVSLTIAHFEVVQVLAYAVMAYSCYYCRLHRPLLFYPAIAFTMLMVIASFTSVAQWLPVYMGQGGSILAATVLLYRAWLDVRMRSVLERWLNALYGFFILFDNAWFCHQLMGDTAERARYENAELTNDFVVLTDIMPHWRLEGIALFTLVVCGLALVGSFAGAACFAEDERYDMGF
jgi:hypothetical protein